MAPAPACLPVKILPTIAPTKVLPLAAPMVLAMARVLAPIIQPNQYAPRPAVKVAIRVLKVSVMVLGAAMPVR